MKRMIVEVRDGELPPTGAKYLYSSTRHLRVGTRKGPWTRERFWFLMPLGHREFQQTYGVYETYSVHFFEVEVPDDPV